MRIILSIIDFAQRWGWLVWLAYVVALATVARRMVDWARRGHALQLTRLACLGVSFALPCTLYALIYVAPSWHVAAVSVSLSGAIYGVYPGRKRVKKWEAELASQAEEKGHPRQIAWPYRPNLIGWGNLLIVTVLIIIVALHLSGSLRSSVIEIAAPIILGFGGGCFVTIGAYSWLWARRKERESPQPLVINFK